MTKESRGLAILGLGTAPLSPTVTQDQVLEHAKSRCCNTVREHKVLAEIYRRTAISSRNIVIADAGPRRNSEPIYCVPERSDGAGPTTGERMKAYEQEVLPLAESACERALSASGVSPDRITHLITVSCTGFYAPGYDIGLIKRLGLPAGVTRTNVGFMGCHGALNALSVALRTGMAHDEAHILICAAELCSLHFQYGWNADNIIANSLFSDGAAALVASGVPASSDLWTIADTASHVVLDHEGDMTWRIGDHGFNMTLSPRVPDIIASRLPTFLMSWLAGHRLSVGDINSWIVHPGGPRIVDAVEDCLELKNDALAVSREVLDQCGNMSSPTVLFILERLQARGARTPCVMLAFGPGLSFEAALLL